MVLGGKLWFGICWSNKNPWMFSRFEKRSTYEKFLIEEFRRILYSMTLDMARWFGNEDQIIFLVIFWVIPLPRIPVTTRIIPFLVGNPYKPSFATVTGKGDNPSYIDISTKKGNKKPEAGKFPNRKRPWLQVDYGHEEARNFAAKKMGTTS